MPIFLFKRETLSVEFGELLMYHWYKMVCVFIVSKILIYSRYKFNHKTTNKCLAGFIPTNLTWLSLVFDVRIIIPFSSFDVTEDVPDWCPPWRGRVYLSSESQNVKTYTSCVKEFEYIDNDKHITPRIYFTTWKQWCPNHCCSICNCQENLIFWFYIYEKTVKKKRNNNEDRNSQKLKKIIYLLEIERQLVALFKIWIFKWVTLQSVYTQSMQKYILLKVSNADLWLSGVPSLKKRNFTLM